LFWTGGRVEDAGAKFISALASILDVETEEEVRHIVEQIDDVAGYINRFSLPVSTLGRIRNNR
jgi:F420-non-reducing hydrogenase small subunit